MKKKNDYNKHKYIETSKKNKNIIKKQKNLQINIAQISFVYSFNLLLALFI